MEYIKLNQNVFYHPNKKIMFNSILLILAMAFCFILFFKTIDFFEKF